MMIRIGANDGLGMVVMLEVVLEELRSRGHMSPAKNSTKRRSKPPTCFQLRRLIRHASLNHRRYEDNYLPTDPEGQLQQVELYDTLMSFLCDYRDTDVPMKVGGVRVGGREVNHTRHGYDSAFKIGDDLFRLVDDLVIEGKVYDPVTRAQHRAATEERMRKIREENRTFIIKINGHTCTVWY